MEHPADPGEAHKPLSWQLEEVKWLQRVDCCQHTTFHQCMLGALSMKGTALCSVHMPDLHRHLLEQPNQSRCNHCRVYHRVLQGLGANSRWRTAAAKEYPEKMCELIARSIHAAVTDRFSTRTPSLAQEWLTDPSVLQFYQPLDPYLDRHAGQDCAMFGHVGETAAGRNTGTTFFVYF